MTAYDKTNLQIGLFRGVAEDIDMPVMSKGSNGGANGIIFPGDEIISVLEWDTESAIETLADVTDNCSISRAGYITNDTAPTSDIWQGMIIWQKNNANDGDLILGSSHPKMMLVTGGAAAADLTATGLAVTDDIFCVIHVTTAAAVASFADVTHLCTHATADVLNCSIATTNDQLWVFYNDRSATAIDNLNLKVTVCDGHATELTVTGITTADTLLGGIHITTKAAIASLSTTITYEITDTNDVGVSATTADDQHIILWHDAG